MGEQWLKGREKYHKNDNGWFIINGGSAISNMHAIFTCILNVFMQQLKPICSSTSYVVCNDFIENIGITYE